ncbi:MAG TPA: 30S ribosomal protein S17e [Candidatus Nanoarchaeia archaeon]|nr:30S ribosomal protein S17e [Candidatus Nanoarchaeia archaeon]
MGRIKTQRVKRKSTQMFAEQAGAFNSSFDDNKKVLDKFYDITSKKLRNTIAGYITRLAKRVE